MQKLFINVKKENIDVEELLLQIFNTLLSYYGYRKEYPEEIQMKSEYYLLIKNNRPDVIMKEENDYFILGMKIVICG
ncbi:MAG: hypothetical protein E7168_03835 [Firmicutes bacterium]|nr:hypothetical protein [Bacillota bacterium]